MALRQPTEFLFQQALLQNAGVYRRKAIDTLRGAGMAKQAASAMSHMLSRPRAEPWLRCRLLFAIGFLQDRENVVEFVLQQAYTHARDQLQDARTDNSLTRDVVSEVHAALFAIGDLYGAPGQEGAGKRMRGLLAEEGLWKLVIGCKEPELFRISRAAAYLLSVTPQEKDDRELLEQLSSHPDEVTAKACAWARTMRFDASGAVVPLHRVPPPAAR